MRVIVKVKDTEINIPCGDGKQSFKWLSLVIQSRLKENVQLRRKYDVEAFIVTEIRNIFGEMLNPKDLIQEHSGPSGLTVRAVVESKYPLDEWEYPDLGPWVKGAFLKSDIGNYWHSELDAWRSTVKKVDESNQSHEQNGTSFIQIGFDFFSEDFKTAFDFDSKNMKWDWMKPINDTHKIKVIDVFKAEYSIICKIFAHYCGFGQGHYPIYITLF